MAQTPAIAYIGPRKESVFAVVGGAVCIQLESRTRFELSPAMLRHGDDSERLRRAIKGMYLTSSRIILGYLYRFTLDNNLFLVRRILARIPDMRNPDPGPSRYTSLAWAALCVHEEIFSYLLDSGHDDEDLSRVGGQLPTVKPQRHSIADLDTTCSFRTLKIIPYYACWQVYMQTNLTLTLQHLHCKTHMQLVAHSFE